MTDKSRKAVPREPDKAMVIAMLREITKVNGWINNDSLAAAWRAAYDASPTQSIPQEPTDAMYHAGMKEIAAAVDADAMPSPLVVWKAMFDAAPVLATVPAAPPKDGEVAALIERLRARKWEPWCREAADALARLSAPVPALTDEQIVAIRDEHLPSQGEPFDCIAFARAILAVPAREWIPVGERLPVDHETVLVFMPKFLWERPNAYRQHDKWYAMDSDEWSGAEFAITHWMPLPPPPAAGK